MTVRKRKGDPAQRRPTLADVAELAGVSLMTASRAMNGERHVSAASMEKVRGAAATLGFVPHQAARSLATNQAGSVALVAPMSGERFFNDPNIAPIIAGASATLTALGSQLVVLIAGDAEQAANAGRHILAQHVDGAILVSPHSIPDVMDSLLSARVPLAVTGFIGERPALDIVDVDTGAGIVMLVERLVRSGRHRIGIVIGPEDDPRSAVHRAAYDRALPPGLPPIVARGDYSVASGARAVEDLLDGRVDGLVFCGDAMAVGGLRSLQHRGLSVPEDVAIVGFDDSSPAETTTPPLTTIHVPFYEIGARMAELVVQRIREPERPGSRMLLATWLAERASG